MGVLAPVSAHVGPSAQPPIDMSGNFPAYLSAELPSNIFPNPSEVITEVSELYNKSVENIFEISRFSAQNRVNRRRGGGLRFFFSSWNLPIHVTWEHMQKFRTIG